MAFNDLYGGRFRSQFALASKYAVLVGVTKDATGSPLSGCTVSCFVTATQKFMASTVSNGSGTYRLSAPAQTFCYCVGYKAGSPDVAGTTVNTLIGVGGYM